MKKPLIENPKLLAKLVKIFDWLSVFSSFVTLCILILKSSDKLADLAINAISIISGSITFGIVICRTVLNQYKARLTSIMNSARSFKNYSVDRKKIISELEKLGPSNGHHFMQHNFRIICRNYAGDEESESLCLELMDIFVSARISIKHAHSIGDLANTNNIKIYVNENGSEFGSNISKYMVDLFARINLNSQIVLSQQVSKGEIMIDLGINR